MNYALYDLVCLYFSILSIFLIICLSDFVDNCKSNVHNISNPILPFCQYQDSSPDLPDRKKPSS